MASRTSVLLHVRPPAGWRRHALDLGLGFLAASLCTGLGWLCRPWADLSFLIMLFLLGSVGTALWRGRWASMAATVLGMLAFDYFFETPAFDLSVSNWPNFVVFTGFLAISQLVANLVHRLRAQAREAGLREREAAALCELAGVLSAEDSPEALRRVAAATLTEQLGVPVSILPPDQAAASGFSQALTGSRGPLGWLQAELPDPGPPGTYLEACGRQVSLALERALLGEEAERAHTKAELESTRSTLLSAISHDFRTPLSTIQGAASTLLQDAEGLPVAELTELAGMIVSEASRLEHLVGNLLDMMRLEAGALKLNAELQPLEEVVGTVLNRLEPLLGPIGADLPDELPPVPLDSVLVEQLLTNLLENAFRHGRGRGVRLRAEAQPGVLLVEVSDEGPGVPRERMEGIFEKFFRAPGGFGDGGTGLGLAICRAIVQVHGGQIWVQGAEGGGASFRFTLPLGQAAP